MTTLDPRVVALGAARLVAGDLRTYGPTGIDGPPDEAHSAVEQVVRQTLGGVTDEATDDSYAVLDGYDESGDIVADYGIRDARAFRFLYRKLNWRVTREETNE